MDSAESENESTAPPHFPEHVMPHILFGESGEDIGAHHHGVPVPLKLLPNKKEFCKKNGAHRLYKTLEKEEAVIRHADAFMENANKIMMATGMGLTQLSGAPGIGFWLTLIGLGLEGINELVVEHARNEMRRAKSHIAVCESDEMPEHDKIKAARSLIGYSKSIHLWEGGTKAIGTVLLYAVGEIYALIDFSNTIKEATETYKDKPKQEQHLAQNFSGALREFLHGLDLPKEKLRKEPGPLKKFWSAINPF